MKASDPILHAIVAELTERKASEIVTLDVRDRCDITDILVIASGATTRHVKALTDHITERLRANHALRPVVEGSTAGNWVVLDFGRIIVHIQRPEVRSYYDLEGLWG